MTNFFKNLYQSFFPYKLRESIFIIRFEISKFFLKRKIILFLEDKISELPDDVIDVLNYLKFNKLCVIPYNFVSNYNFNDIVVYNDLGSGLNYVLHKGYKLFFKRSMTPIEIKKYYTSLLIEQDSNSPHCYLSESFYIQNGTILVDVGAAEGFLSIEQINNASRIYMFEVNPEWIEALNETFKPWIDKVTIINKYASNINCENQITLDSYFSDFEKIGLVKIDVDGAESIVLDGISSLFKAGKISNLALCTYHNQSDYENFSELLTKMNFTVMPTEGYMIFYCDNINILPPYLRKGVIRAKYNL